jgi:hypothetical protein
MRCRVAWLVLLVTVVALPLGGCATSDGAVEATDSPAKVESIEGTNLHRVILVDQAAERIGIQTAAVQPDAAGGDPPRAVVAYGAIVYDPDGATSVYTNPDPLVYVRRPVTVDHIQGDTVVLSDGPPVGTVVVTVGAEELLGAETGIGEFE